MQLFLFFYKNFKAAKKTLRMYNLEATFFFEIFIFHLNLQNFCAE